MLFFHHVEKHDGGPWLFSTDWSIGSVNAFIAYMSSTGSTMVLRFEFIKKLGHELLVPHLQRRLAETPNLPRDLKL